MRNKLIITLYIVSGITIVVWFIGLVTISDNTPVIPFWIPLIGNALQIIIFVAIVIKDRIKEYEK